LNRWGRLSVWFCVVWLALQSGCSSAQSRFSVRDNYTKTDVSIPMRDGKKLYTVIFAPKDASKNYPILMERTPYSVPYGPDNVRGSIGPSAHFAESGYIVVYQDVRGRYMSEGDYVNMRPELGSKHGKRDIDESTDTYDTIDWLIHNVPHNNGRVGMWGISYPGFYAAAGAINAHPALKAVSPQAPIADWFLGDDDHHNGAFYLMDNFSWDFDSGFDWPRTTGPSRSQPSPGLRYNSNDAYQFYLDLGPLSNGNARYFHDRVPFWNELMEHGTYDSYWKARNLLPHLQNIRPAMLTVGGWFDAEDFYGPLHIFKTIERTSPKTENFLVVGPWPHGGWAGGARSSFGDIPFGSATATTYRDEVEFPFFEHYLKDEGEWKESKAHVFVTGSNQWVSFDAWPPRDLHPESLYFSPAHALSISQPRASSAAETSDSYVSDPAHPVPYIATASRGSRRDSTYMISDQRFAADRPDVLTYKTEPLDKDMTVVGPITADLFVSTSGTDSDWIVKVIDVYPPDAPDSESATGNTKMADYEMLVRADVMRGKFRNSFEKPEPFVPGKVTRVKFDLPDVCHTFRKGHRLMVQVQSSWFPLVDRNPQTFLDITKAAVADFHPATQRLYHTAAYPSRIILSTR
jgi:putative CocE/NonD family hydrolase